MHESSLYKVLKFTVRLGDSICDLSDTNTQSHTRQLVNSISLQCIPFAICLEFTHV